MNTGPNQIFLFLSEILPLLLFAMQTDQHSPREVLSKWIVSSGQVGGIPTERLEENREYALDSGMPDQRLSGRRSNAGMAKIDLDQTSPKNPL